MKISRGYVVCLSILAMLVIPYRAFAFIGVDAGVGYWRQVPSGTMQYKPVAGTTGDIDLKDDLYFDAKNKPFVRIKAELPLILPNIYLMATPMTFEGSGQLARTISFGDTQFNVNAQIESKIKLDHYDLAFFYPIPLLNTATAGVLNIELGLNARKFDFEGTITQPSASLTSSKSLSLYVPMVYGGIQVKPVDAVSIEAEIRGIAYGGNHYYDYLGRLKFNPIPLVYIAGGYRAETLKIDENDVKADIKFGGPFFEVGLSF
jgi:outer membrane protein